MRNSFSPLKKGELLKNKKDVVIKYKQIPTFTEIDSAKARK
jgi:hypothetical protein